MSKDEFNKWYEKHHKALRQWNDNRAAAEKSAIEKFWRMANDPILHPSKFKTKS